MRPFATIGDDCVKPVTGCINRAFGNKEPWQVAAITATTVLGGVWIWTELTKDESKLQNNSWVSNNQSILNTLDKHYNPANNLICPTLKYILLSTYLHIYLHVCT